MFRGRRFGNSGPVNVTDVNTNANRATTNPVLSREHLLSDTEPDSNMQPESSPWALVGLSHVLLRAFLDDPLQRRQHHLPETNSMPEVVSDELNFLLRLTRGMQEKRALHRVEFSS
jgi:hypothetical protein